MKQIIDNLRQLPLWGKVAVGIGCGFLLFFLLTEIQSCSDRRKDRKAQRRLDEITGNISPMSRADDSLAWQIENVKKEIETLKKQDNEAHANTVAAQRKLDSLRAKLPR